MNEFYYLKMFFKTAYDNRIRPIVNFVKYDIILNIKLLLMTEKQKETYFEKEAKKQAELSSKMLETLLKGVVTAGVISAVNSISLTGRKKNKPTEKEEDKKND